MGSQETIVPHMNLSLESQEKILSVSGKKKCSHCGDELGKIFFLSFNFFLNIK